MKSILQNILKILYHLKGENEFLCQISNQIFPYLTVTKNINDK